MKKWGIAVLVLTLMLTVTDALAAKRLGGGGNLGQHRDLGSMQRAPQSHPTPPPAPSKPVGQGPVSPAPVPAAPPPQRSSWWGPLAGFAGGALLGSMLFGHGGLGGGGGFFGILVWGALGVLFVLLLRRFFNAAGPISAPQSEVVAERSVAPAPQAVTASSRPPLQLPLGFDLEAFLHQARVAYVRLQAANDAGDLQDLKAFTTPEMYAECSLAIQDRHAAPQQVEIMELDAELLDLKQEGEVAWATVQYFVTAREDNGPRESFSELWHVEKRLADANAPWLLAGIEQIS